MTIDCEFFVKRLILWNEIVPRFYSNGTCQGQMQKFWLHWHSHRGNRIGSCVLDGVKYEWCIPPNKRMKVIHLDTPVDERTAVLIYSLPGDTADTDSFQGNVKKSRVCYARVYLHGRSWWASPMKSLSRMKISDDQWKLTITIDQLLCWLLCVSCGILKKIERWVEDFIGLQYWDESGFEDSCCGIPSWLRKLAALE